MQDISVSFRIAVNANKEKIIEILKEYKSCLTLLEEKWFCICGNNMQINYNEDYDKELSIVDEDGFLYYENNIDFYPKDDTIMLENQVQLAKEILQKFTNYGIASEIIAEFENLL